MDLKTFAITINQIAEEKGILREKVIETVELALAAAYKKEYGKRGQIIRAKFDPDTGDVKFWQVKIAVEESMLKPQQDVEALLPEISHQEESEAREFSGTDVEKDAREGDKKAEQEESAYAEEEAEEEAGDRGAEAEEKKIKFNPEKHIMLEEAQAANPDIKPGEELVFPLEAKFDFGRIAAQTAKQVIIQRIREAEKESITSEYKEKVGEVISGIVQRVEQKAVFVDIGKTVGLMLYEEQIPGEEYRPGQRIKAYLMKVEDTPKGPAVFLSRSYPKMISKLFELEVPEVASGTVVIKSIAREPGLRSKIAAASQEERVDPIGSMVGQKGTRVSAVIGELGGEKIDIIAWSEDPAKYIANALSPAKAAEVKIDKDTNQAVAYVPEEQLSLAIGKNGQNVRLAAQLTGWKIDVRPYRPAKEEQKEAEEAKEEKEEEKEEKKSKKNSPKA